MLPIAREIDEKLSTLSPETAKLVEQLIRDALLLAAEPNAAGKHENGKWPHGYFERTAGALAGESFDRPQQGSSQEREQW